MEARLERHNNLPAMNDGAMMVRQFASASHFKICNLKWVYEVRVDFCHWWHKCTWCHSKRTMMCLMRDESSESRTSGHDRISMTNMLAILAHGSVTKQRNAESLHQLVSDRLGTTT